MSAYEAYSPYGAVSALSGDAADLPPDKNMGTVLLTLTAVLVSLTIVTTLLRIWARGNHGTLGWDDYTIIVCCLLAIGRTTIQIISVHHGNGRHRVYISPEEYQYVNFLTWMTQIFLFLNIGLLKCSICILILRIKDTKILKYGLYTMMGGLILTNLECVLVLLAECSPVAKYWNPTVPGKCWDTKVRIYSIYLQVAYSVITDLICALLPIIVLWNVKIARNLKWAVCGLMSMGLIATASALVRASSLGTKTTDLSYDYCIAAIWANTELHLGIIATNLSLSRSIYGYFSGKTKTMLSGQSRSNVMNSFSRNKSGRPISKDGSNSSQIELSKNVIKKTELHVEEERSSREGAFGKGVHVTQQSWNESPTTEKGFVNNGMSSRFSREKLGK